MKLLTKTMSVVLLLSGFSLYSMEQPEGMEREEWYKVVPTEEIEKIEKAIQLAPLTRTGIVRGGKTVIERLIAEMNVETQEKMLAAIKADNLEELKNLIKIRKDGEQIFSEMIDDKGNNPLHKAFESNSSKVTRYIIDVFPQFLVMKNEEKETPLAYATKHSYGGPDLPKLIEEITATQARYKRNK